MQESSLVAGLLNDRLGGSKLLSSKLLSLVLLCLAPSWSWAEPRRLWLQDGAVLDAPGGRPILKVPSPTIVMLLADGRIRVETRERMVEGYPSDRQRLGLYVQVTGSLLHTETGPAVGRVYPGAFLPVLACGKAVCEIRVAQRLRTQFRVHGFVSRSVLGVAKPALSQSSPRGQLFRDHYRQLRLDPQGKAFSETACGPLWVVETRKAKGGPQHRVAQIVEGVELIGWTDTPLSDLRGEYRCPPRVVVSRLSMSIPSGGSLETARQVPAVPRGYSKVTKGRPAGVLATLMKKRLSLYLPAVEGNRIHCRRHDFRPCRGCLSDPAERGARRALLVSRRRDDGGLSVVKSAVELVADELTIWGECHRNSDRTGGCSGEAFQYWIVDAGADRLSAVGRFEPDRAAGYVLTAFHPDDAEWWFLSERACRRHADVQHSVAY